MRVPQHACPVPMVVTTRPPMLPCVPARSLLLAVLILPRSASVECCRELKRALKSLVELNRQVRFLGGKRKKTSGAWWS